MILMLMALSVTLALLAYAFRQSRLRVLRLPPAHRLAGMVVLQPHAP